MLKIAILDDDINICSHLEKTLAKILNKDYLKFEIDVFYSCKYFIKNLEIGEKYDILFLDIEIDELTGIDIGKYIRQNLKDEITKIIYISSHTNYAMELFKIRPIDFLIKPIKDKDVASVLNIALNLINNQYEYFNFNIGVNKHRVCLKDIIYFSTVKQSKKIILKTINNEFIFYGKIKEIYENLKEYRFIMPFKSYIVNYDYIESIEKDRICLVNKEQVPLSRYKVKEVKELQMKFMREI